MFCKLWWLFWKQVLTLSCIIFQRVTHPKSKWKQFTNFRGKEAFRLLTIHCIRELAGLQLYWADSGGVIVYSLMYCCRFYSYHQKYLLRQRRHILDELNLSEDEIKKSHVCTRLNGYCGGYASVADLDKEIDGFGLSEEGKTRLRDLVKRGKHH